MVFILSFSLAYLCYILPSKTVIKTPPVFFSVLYLLKSVILEVE